MRTHEHVNRGMRRIFVTAGPPVVARWETLSRHPYPPRSTSEGAHRALMRPVKIRALAVTSQLTTWIADHSVYAVFALMAIDAVLPFGGELVMLYAGVVAAGAIAGADVTILGVHAATGLESYLVLAAAGTLGSLAGALIGWAIGARGGRPLVERHGSRLHLGPRRFARAEDWFERYGGRAVFVGRLTPIVRSFISIPAGVLGIPLGIYVALTLLASLIWCFGFAAAGWAAAAPGRPSTTTSATQTTPRSPSCWPSSPRPSCTGRSGASRPHRSPSSAS